MLSRKIERTESDRIHENINRLLKMDTTDIVSLFSKNQLVSRKDVLAKMKPNKWVRIAASVYDMLRTEMKFPIIFVRQLAEDGGLSSHYHDFTEHIYPISGTWTYKEKDKKYRIGDVIHIPAGTIHTIVGSAGAECIILIT